MNDSKIATIACWACATKMSVTVDQVGDSVECPECQAKTTVPPEAFGLPPVAKTVRSGAASPLPQVPPEGELYGIGGWLLLPAIGLIAGIVLGVAWFLASLLFVLPEIAGNKIDEYVVALIMDFVVFAFLIYTAVRFFGRRKNAPGTYKILCILAVLASGASVAIGVFEDIEDMIFMYGFNLIANVAAAAILIPYFSVSRRVKNTFIR